MPTPRSIQSWMIAIASLILTLATPAALAQPLTWTGAAGDNVWTNPLNWSPTAVPGLANDVTIAVGTGPITIPTSATAGARSITTSRPIVVGSSAGLTILAGLTFSPDGALTLNGSSFVDLRGTQSILGTGTITLNNASIYASNVSTITIGAGVTIVPGSAFGTLWYNTGPGSTFINFGTIRATSGRSIFFNLGVSLDNRGLVEATGASALVDIPSGVPVVNSGSIRASLAGRVNLFALSNSGMVVSDGAASFIQLDGFSNAGAGTMSAVSLGTLRLAGTYATAALAPISRTGGGVVLLSGIINGAGGPPLRLVTDPVETALESAQNAGVQLNNVTLGAPLRLRGGVNRISGGLALNGRVITMESATLDFLGSQTVSGPGEIRGTTGNNNLYASNMGQVTLNADVTTRAAGGSLSFWWNSGPPTSFNNLGTIAADPGFSINAFSDTTLINRGVINLSGPGNDFALLRNEGSINVSGAGVQAGMPAAANVGAGVTTIANTAAVTVSGSYAPSTLTGFVTTTGGVLRLAGTITGGTLPIPGLNTVLSSPALSGVTINQPLTISSGVSVTGGLTIRNTTATVAAYLPIRGGLALDAGAIDLNAGTLDFRGTQSISGSGEIRASGGNLYSSDLNAAVTIEPGITIRTVSAAQLNFWWNGSPPTSFINRGAIRAQSGPIFFRDQTALFNQGLLESTSAAALINFENTTTLGDYTSATRTLSGAPATPGTWVARNAGGFNFPVSSIDALTRAFVEHIGPGARIILDGPSSVFTGLNQAAGPSRLESVEGVLVLDNGRVLNAPLSPSVFTNSGQIRVGPAARLNVSGDYSQTATGRLAIEANGAAPAGRGLVTATSTATFGGSIEFLARSGFLAACADAFDLLTAPVVSGFIGDQLATLPSQLPASFSLQPSAVRLTISNAGLFPALLNDTPFAPCGSNVTIAGRPTTPTVALQWLRNGAPIADGPTPSGSVVSGAATSTLTITGLGNPDAGSYVLQATTACGQILSDSADVALLGVCNCPTDFNHDGATDPDDLADFIACYFALPPCDGADFNNDSAIDPDDLADYIAAFFSGC